MARNMRARLGIVLLLLIGLSTLAALSQSFSRAGDPPFQPRVAAFFKDKDRLQVAVFLENNVPGTLSGNLEVVLNGASRARLASHERALRQEASVGAHVFELQVTRAAAAKGALQINFQGRHFDVALDKVLLAKAHETTASGGMDFVADGPGAYLVTVQGALSATQTIGLPGADVTLLLREADGKLHPLFQGKTDRDGRVAPKFQVPAVAPGQHTLVIRTTSALGEEKLERAINVTADVKILLVSDRPMYQPGHLMHLRALALRPFNMKPVAGKELTFEVEDPKGNKVFKRTVATSDFGIAAIDFQLADEVNMGPYHVRALIGQQRADKTVTVKRYVLPKFKTEIVSDKAFYLPKEKIKLEIQVDYFFGKPVAGTVEVTASTFDVQFKEFHKFTGKLDATGHTKVEVQLPDYFVGQPLQKGDALVKMDVAVTDSADHRENVVKTYPVSEQPIRLSLIPEGGKLAPDMENRVFVAAVSADGRPVTAKVNIWLGQKAQGQPLTSLTTNEAGLAEFRVTPRRAQFRQSGQGQHEIEMAAGKQQVWGQNSVLDIHAEAKDSQGNQAASSVTLNSQPFGENILLRLDKAIYQTGDRVAIEIQTSAGMPTVFIDVVRGGQIMLSRWLDVKNGQARQSIDMPPNLFGSLEIHAYQMLSSGEIIRDSRVAYVQPRNDLKIEVKAEKTEYLPGEDGRVRFLVTDAAGKPAAAALGIIIVDEAVYALQELQPGLEKVYFTLQEELLKPQVQVHFNENVGDLIRQPVLPRQRQQIAEVLLTGVKLPPPRRWVVDPVIDRKQKMTGQIQQIAHAIWGQAWGNKNSFFDTTKEGQLAFKKNLLADMVKANQLAPHFLEGPFGGTLTLDEVLLLDPALTADNLARAITIQRMNQVYWSIVNYTNQHRAQYFKNDKWVLTDKVIADALQNQNLDMSWSKDAWGQPLRIVVQEKAVNNPFGQPQFQFYELTAAGPDRQIGTKDDLKLVDLQNFGRWAGATRTLTRGRTEMLGEFDNFFAFGARGAVGGGGVTNAPMRAMGTGVQAGMPGVTTYAAAAVPGTDRNRAASQTPALKVREFFPETMLWQPALITDDKGRADMAINFADSITTWRLSASANSLGGALGGVNLPLKVFQDFFVDIDLPISLTQRDEVAFPVAVYNYLKTPQTVKLELTPEPWFELIDGQGFTRSLDLKPNEVTAVQFRVRATKIGSHALTVKALGSQKSDAVKRIIEIVPNGERREKVINDRLVGNTVQTLDIPAGSVSDASRLFVRLYPGVMSQVMDGMEGMMRMPGGCFEQTSSSAYPNILIVDYIKKSKLTSPEMLLRAEQYLNVGYQRLLTFERPGGGFDWWGRDEPLIWLSAYGLQEFSDMARVYPIDRAIIDRTQAFLLKKMDKDGTWSNLGATHSETIASMGDPKLLLTSYVTWSLLESGFPKDKLRQSVDFIRAHLEDAHDNAYILALAANALAAYDAKDDSTLSLLRRLEKQRKDLPEWKAALYPTTHRSLTYAHGDSVNVEATALTVLAMVKTGQFTNSVNQALTYLIKSKGNGSWGTTSATILSLKALLAGMGGPKVAGRVDFTVTVDGQQIGQGSITEDNADVLRAFDVKVEPGAHKVQIESSGETNLMFQIVGRHFEPWKQTAPASVKKGFDVNVSYDRTRLATNDLLRASATLKYQGDLPANMVMLDLGIPPGFTVDSNDFTEMVNKRQVNKFSITARQVILYLSDLRPGDAKTFEYTLRAKYPLRAHTPASVAYEYYAPDNRATAAPVDLVVDDRK